MQNYIFTSDIFKGSRYEKGHPLDMDRVWPSVELLKLMGWVNDNQIIKNEVASIEELIKYHDKGYVEALQQAEINQYLPDIYKKKYNISNQIIVNQIGAISIGVVKGTVCIDLDYPEDSSAEVDCNVVMSGDGQFIEFQSTGEEAKFTKQTILDFIDLVEKAMPEINKIQDSAISIA